MASALDDFGPQDRTSKELLRLYILIPSGGPPTDNSGGAKDNLVLRSQTSRLVGSPSAPPY